MQNGVFDSGKYEANVGGIRGLREAKEPISETPAEATTLTRALTEDRG